MFTNLTNQLQYAIKFLRGQAKITESNIDDTLRSVRLALLEADVHIQVVKVFLQNVKTKAIGTKIVNGLNPAQQFIDILYNELHNIMSMGDGLESALDVTSRKPAVIMVVGLQGSGKTTTCVKLAAYLKKMGNFPLLASVDIYRPAAIEQLRILSDSIGIPNIVIKDKDPIVISQHALLEAKNKGYDIIILDTAGRLHVDQKLMDELVSIKNICQPTEILFVADAMTGHDAIVSAKEFHSQLSMSGIILSKADSDARGGAAFSIKHITGVPIKFIGNGELVKDFERFYPKRMAQRILGMGDVLTLIEKINDNVTDHDASQISKINSKEFTLNDMLLQLKHVQKIGNAKKIVDMLPGINKVTKNIDFDVTDKRIKSFESIMNSMTIKERLDYRILNNKRKLRIASGSGRSVYEINQLIKQFLTVKKIMLQISSSHFLKKTHNMRSFFDKNFNLPF